MTGRERFLAVFRGKIPDRVPVTLFIQDQGHFIAKLHPDLDQWDHLAVQKRVVDFQREMGCDVFVRVLFGINDPLSIHFGGLNTAIETDSWRVRKQVIQRDGTRVEHAEIETPEGTLTQEFSINEVKPGTYLYCCTQKPIRTMRDLEIAEKYEPGMPEEWPEKVRAHVAEIKDYVGNDGIVGSWTPHGPFNNASLLYPQDELYMLFRTDPPFYERLMRFAMKRILDYTAAIDAAGVDVHCVGGNVPGGFLGKANYDKYILPFEKEYIAFVQRNGTPAMYHNCGQIMNLVDSYKELGARIVEPFSPPPLGDCADLAAAKRQVDGAYVMLSGIDQVNVLEKGPPDEVRKATQKAILDGKPGGGFILQPVDFLEYDTPLENIRAYVETALAFADY
ncbi:MAG: hypothetical protein D6741_04775 [Planctomycetota bacterium]|nr:MAG: hypothetical protein D6741_04775 [Planctomycetota bacterium]